MGSDNLCFKHKNEKYQNSLSEKFHFLVIKFSIYLNRNVFIMCQTIKVQKTTKILIHSWKCQVIIKRTWLACITKTRLFKL